MNTMKTKTLVVAATLCVAHVLHSAQSANVKDFGAVGDGVHDDTLAIQKAADALLPGGVVGRRDMWPMCGRIKNSRQDGPNGELLFPAGVYRVTGPVELRHSVYVRGEKGAVVRNETLDQNTFFFRDAYRCKIEGLAFEGGFNQTYFWTRTLESANIVVRNCTFRNAAGTAVFTESYREDPSLVTEGVPTDKLKVTHAARYRWRRGEDGRCILEERDLSVLRPYNNSTLFTVEDCRFEGNARSFCGSTDGIVVRDSDFCGAADSTNAQIRAGGEVQIVRCRISAGPAARAAVEAPGSAVSLTDCSFSLKGATPAVAVVNKPLRGLRALQLTLSGCEVGGGDGPVIRFAEGCLVSLMGVYDLRAVGASGVRKVFSFEKAPTAAELEELVAGARGRPKLPVLESISFATSGVGGEAFDLSLPETLEACRAEIPAGVLRRRQFHPTRCEFPEAEFADGSIGSEMLNDEKNPDDTAKLRALLAKAAGAGGGTVVLPPRWIKLTETVVLPDNVKVTCRGRAVVSQMNDAGPIFRVEEGSRAMVENVEFRWGANALECAGRRGFAQLRNCYYYDQLREAVHAEAGAGGGFRVEVVGGVANTPYLYRGNASPAVFDGVWYSMRTNHKREEWVESVSGIVNLPGGVMEMYDVLGVPLVFEWYNKSMQPLPGNPDKGRFHAKWIDNYGTLRTFSYRFGGEWGGITPIYHFGAGASTYVDGCCSSTRNGRLKAGHAQVLADVAEPDATIANHVTFNFSDRPAAYAAKFDEEGKPKPVKAKVVNCFPFRR